jgi:dephospho-CoA kinase
MKIIGLTGGIGTGKTTIAKCFSLLNVPIFNSDATAKKLYSEAEIVSAVTKILGETVLDTSGEINKTKMAKLIFNDNEKLTAINGLIHPIVKRKFENFCSKHSHANYVIKEAAILFESGSYKDCHKIISISSPIELRIKRIKERDGSSKEEIKVRMDKQWSAEKISKSSDYVIVNNERSLVYPQVIEIDNKLRLI